MADDKKIIFSMVGVSKIYPPSKQVLKDIYLSFFYGAKIGIIGLNGSGKSSLLKIIAGVDKSYQGEVVFSPGYSVGYLEQEPKLDDTKTVKEVVQEAVQETVDLMKEYEEINMKFAEPMSDDEMTKLIERQGEVMELLDQHDAWNLDNKLERAMDALRCPDEDALVKHLSGGERRRTEIARCLAIEPKFVMLDEPFAGVDPIAVQEIQDVVWRLKDKNIGILITDHNVDETLMITDRAYLLFEGKILFHGTPEELAANPVVRTNYLGRDFELKKKNRVEE